MQGHQPPDTPHPMWCVKDTDTGVHCGEMHRHGDIFVWLLQDPGGSYDGPQIYLDGRLIRCTAAKGWASTFAVLGHPELAATITRLAELAEADQAFTRPQPAVDPLACGRCGTTGHPMDPVTDSHAPGGVKNECHDLHECGERAAVKL